MDIKKINNELNKEDTSSTIKNTYELIKDIMNSVEANLIDWLKDEVLYTIEDFIEDAIYEALEKMPANAEQGEEISEWVRNMNGLPHPPIAGNMQTRAQIEKRISNLIEELNNMNECEHKRIKRAELSTLQSILF